MINPLNNKLNAFFHAVRHKPDLNKPDLNTRRLKSYILIVVLYFK